MRRNLGNWFSNVRWDSLISTIILLKKAFGWIAKTDFIESSFCYQHNNSGHGLACYGAILLSLSSQWLITTTVYRENYPKIEPKMENITSLLSANRCVLVWEYRPKVWFRLLPAITALNENDTSAFTNVCCEICVWATQQIHTVNQKIWHWYSCSKPLHLTSC